METENMRTVTAAEPNDDYDTPWKDAELGKGLIDKRAARSSETITVPGELTIAVRGELTIAVRGELTATVRGELTNTVCGVLTNTVCGELTNTVCGELTNTVCGELTNTVCGELTNTVCGELTNTVRGELTNTVRGELVEPLVAHQHGPSTSSGRTGFNTQAERVSTLRPNGFQHSGRTGFNTQAERVSKRAFDKALLSEVEGLRPNGLLVTVRTVYLQPS